MTDFLNPLGGRFLGRSGPVAPTTISGTIPDPPRGFRQLDPGTIIKGVVMSRENDGLVTIATDKGTVRVASNAALPPGTHVTLEVRPTGDRLQVLILASDAVRTGAPGQLQSATPAPAGPSPPPAPPAGTATPPPAGNVPQATTTGTAPTNTPPANMPAAGMPATGTPATGTPATGTSATGGPGTGTLATGAPAPPASSQPPPTTTPIQVVGSTLPAIVLQPQSAVPPPPAPPPAPVPSAPPTSAPSTSAPPAIASPASASPASIPPTSAPPTAALPTITPPVTVPLPSTPQPSTPQPSTPLPSTPLPSTPLPGTPLPSTPLPGTPLPSTPLPSTPLPGTPLPSTPLPGTPPTNAPATTTPLASVPPTGAPPPQFQIQLPNGQIITLPVTTTPPAVMPAPQPAMPIQILPIQIQPAQIPPTQFPPVTPTAPPGTAPVLIPQAQAPVPGEPARVAQPPMITPPPTASTLPGDVQQRILALFAAPPAPTTMPSPLPNTPPVIAAAAPPLPPGAELQLRVLAVQIGNQHPIEIDPAAQLGQNGKESQIVFGRVIAVTPAGHAVIHTPVGNILLQQRSSLPVGAQLALAIDTIEAPPPAPVVAAPVAVQTPQQALLSLARGWPTLADLIAILQGGAPQAAGKGAIDPALARELLAHLPQMGSRLGAGMLAGLAAFRSGDIGRLLGPLFAARGLGPEREEMVRRLRGEFTQLSSLAQDRPEAEWRALFLPYLDDRQQVQRINLFYRRHRKGEAGNEDGGGGTRFVVEADFTRLGSFQLDGLMRQHRFDLMIRSHLRVDERMRRDIEAIYEEARGLTGFSGAIAFQTVEEFPVSPLEELKQQADRVSV